MTNSQNDTSLSHPRDENGGSLLAWLTPNVDRLPLAIVVGVVSGMSFRSADISVSTNRLRRMVLGHSLISYLFNAVIVATMVNLIVGFASGS